ncbi:RNA binding protein, putative [Ricinus communis]|uniref:RNA binding protein, putative n=1 Tax=Ricinus communis TaxID=3988 RepID=B9T8F0_RICCO|nr:RNA binding protein, putative [Ricinus communis]
MDNRDDNADNDGWQRQGGRRIRKGSNGYNLIKSASQVATDNNQGQNGDDNLKQERKVKWRLSYYRKQGGRFYNEHGGRSNRLDSSGSAEENNGKHEVSNVDNKDSRNVMQWAVDGENNDHVVEEKEPVADTAEAANGTNESNRVAEGYAFLQLIKMTLKEYEKLQLEKRKALDSLKRAEQRKVNLDKDFESMQLLEKKTEDELPIKQVGKIKNDTRKKNNNKKSMSIDEFLKPAYDHGRGQWRDRRPFGGRGRNGGRPCGDPGIYGERPNNGGRNRDGGRPYGGPRHEGEKCADGHGIEFFVL